MNHTRPVKRFVVRTTEEMDNWLHPQTPERIERIRKNTDPLIEQMLAARRAARQAQKIAAMKRAKETLAPLMREGVVSPNPTIQKKKIRKHLVTRKTQQMSTKK